MFNIGASMKESSQALFIGELSLFQKLSIILFMCANPLFGGQSMKVNLQK
jgi:pentose-5-phosphate-3-epimerase